MDLVCSHLEIVPDAASADFRIETADRTVDVRFPSALRDSKSGAAATDYGLLEEVVLGDWLHGVVAADGVGYFKEATGEREALERGDGDILFRMRPVEREEFQSVVEGGEVYPHKTTYFYPKLWSGMVLWELAEPCPDSVQG